MADDAVNEIDDAWRNYALGVHHQTSRDIDQAVLTVSSGIVGASAIFNNPTEGNGLSIWAWGPFAVAILLTLVSFYLSQRATARAIDDHYAGKRFDSAIFTPTKVVTYAAGVVFLAGLTLLAVFGATNP